MKAHEKDFIIPWNKVLEICKENGQFDNINKPFEIITIKMDRHIGYCNLVETNQNDEIIYAKRIGRDIYTKFVKGRNAKLTNCVTVLLNKSHNRNNEYFAVTMFPGNEPQKEPEDMNISSYNELVNSLKFWSGHALIFDEDIIQIGSEKANCPYKNYYLTLVS